MLGVGWTEMLVLGVVALIVIGPKELPALMQKLGRFAGTVRRMGSDFQRELNKTTGLDEVRNLRSAITAPLKQTTDAIRKEFNTVGASGKVEPSGAIKPADPKAESVVDEIKAAAGLPFTKTAAESMREAVTKGSAARAAAAAAPVAAKPVKAARVQRVKPAPTAEVTTTELSPPQPAAKQPTPRKSAAAVKPVESPAPVEALPPRAKPAAPKPAAAARPKAAAKPKHAAKPKAAAAIKPKPKATAGEAATPAPRRPAAKKTS